MFVGPFYLNLALGLGTTKIGLVMAVGPMIFIFSGIPSGRLVDIWGAQRVIFAGLDAMATGTAALAFLSAVWGLSGYLIAIAILTPGYQLFQAANNTAVMASVPADQREAFSGILALSRNLGLVMGAVGLGAIFAYGTRMTALDETDPVSVQCGLQMTFSLAAIMLIAGIYLVRTRRQTCPVPIRARSLTSDASGDGSGRRYDWPIRQAACPITAGRKIFGPDRSDPDHGSGFCWPRRP